MSFNFAPKGWAMCNGQLLPLNQNQALFALLGTMYGGNGQTNFALPDLRGRVAMHTDHGAYYLGQRGGEEAHTVTMSEMPAHTHFVTAMTGAGEASAPGGNRLAVQNNLYTAPANLVALAPSTVSNVGGSQPHENRQPYTVLNFCIALNGFFPSPN